MSTLAYQDDSPRETIAAAIASVLIHLLVISLFALSVMIPPIQFVPEKPDQEPVEMTLVPMEAPKPAEPSYVRTTPQNVEKAPENAPFESDNNTQAASEAAPSGTAPVPSVDGRESPSVELANREYTQGMQSQPSAPAPESAAQPPQPAPVEEMTPPPVQLALRDAPKPNPERVQQPKPEARAAQPQPPAAPGFQPQTRVTRIRGNLSNRGKASVDAAATPLGRYKKMVSDAIGSRWYYYVNNQIGILNVGTVDIRFQLEPNGKVKGIKVLSNTSNESFASVSISSIAEAEIPPIPPEVAKLLDNGRLEIDYSFTILSN